MKYRHVGKTGLKVSAVSLGGWLTFGASVEDNTAERIIHAAIDGGINFLDLADIYAKGQSELVTGRAIKNVRRSDLVISSKVFWPMSDNPNDRGLSRKHIMESVEKSLKRLGTDYLDLYFCHRFDKETPLEETVRAMDDLVRQGKILYWGTSVWNAQQLKDAHAIADKRNLYAPVVEQPMYHLLDRSIEDAVMPTAASLGMGLVVWSPLAGGILTGKYNDGVPEDSRAARSSWLKGWLNEENLDKVRELSTMAAQLGATEAQVALAWLLTRPEVTSVITGATRIAHIESNLKAVELELPQELVDHLDTLFTNA